MGAIEVLILFGVVVTLVALALSRLARPRGGADLTKRPARPNVVFWFVGSMTALVGLILLLAGAQEVGRGPVGPGPEAQETADAASLVTWGAVVLVNGVYVWRGARRRGLHDRFGRLLIIVGYVVLGVALSRSIHLRANGAAAPRCAWRVARTHYCVSWGSTRIVECEKAPSGRV